MWEEYQDFNFDHVKFETSIRYANAFKIVSLLKDQGFSKGMQRDTMKQLQLILLALKERRNHLVQR